MKCDQVERHLSEYLDEELESEVASAIQVHLSACDTCSNRLSELRSIDTKLRGLVLPDLSARIRAAVSAAAEESTVSKTGLAGPWHGWAMIVAVAASIVIVIAWPKMQVPTVPPPVAVVPAPNGIELVAATIVRGTGDVEILPLEADAWETLSCEQPRGLRNGTRVRTSSDSLCEIETPNRARIRVDKNAELLVRDASQIEVRGGQVWCETSANGPLWLKATDSLPLTFACPSSSEVQVTISERGAECTSLGEQDAQLTVGAVERQLPRGEKCLVDSDRNIKREAAGFPAAKAWQLPLLALDENRRSAELTSILTPMLAEMGRTKVAYIYEQQIRALGPVGAIPLLAFVVDGASASQPDLRRTAIRIASGQADSTAIELLEKLVDDDDSYVSATAAKTLARVRASQSEGSQRSDG